MSAANSPFLLVCGSVLLSFLSKLEASLAPSPPESTRTDELDLFKDVGADASGHSQEFDAHWSRSMLPQESS